MESSELSGMPQQQADRLGADQLLANLLSLMDAQVAALRAIHAAYERESRVQESHAYLKGWFASRIDAFGEQRAKIARAESDVAYRSSWPFGNVLAWYQSLGQAFDVDLQWSGRDDEVHIRNGDMQQVAHQLRPLVLNAGP